MTTREAALLTGTICQHLAHDLPCEECGQAVAAIEPLVDAMTGLADSRGFTRGWRAAQTAAASGPEGSDWL